MNQNYIIQWFEFLIYKVKFHYYYFKLIFYKSNELFIQGFYFSNIFYQFK